jgi:hypothetical protein
VAPSHLEVQGPAEVAPVVQPGQGVGNGRALRPLEPGPLDDRRIGQQLLHIRQVVDGRDAEPGIAPEGASHIGAMAQQVVEQPLGLDLRYLEVSQQAQGCRAGADTLGLSQLPEAGHEAGAVGAVIDQQVVEPFTGPVVQPRSRHGPPLAADPAMARPGITESPAGQALTPAARHRSMVQRGGVNGIRAATRTRSPRGLALPCNLSGPRPYKQLHASITSRVGRNARIGSQRSRP